MAPDHTHRAGASQEDLDDLRDGIEAASVARGSAWGTIAMVVTIVSGLALAVIIARYLGPSSRGIYFLTTFVAGLIVLVGDLGLSTSGLVFATKDRVPRARLHGSVLGLSLAITAVTAVAVPVFYPLLRDNVLDGMTMTDAWFVVGGVGLALYARLAGALLTGIGRIPELSAIGIVAGVAAVPVTILALELGGRTVVWALTAWLVVAAMTAVGIGFEAARRMGGVRAPTRSDLRELFGFGLRSHIGTISHQGFLRADVLFISARSGPAAVGFYSLASTLAERLSSLGAVVYTAGASHVGSRSHADAGELMARMVRIVLLVVLPVAVLLAAVSDPLVRLLFGADFEPTATPFVLLLPGAVALTVWYLLSLYIIAALERPTVTTVIQLTGMLASLPLYWAAVGEWGMSGAAIVSSLVYIGVMVAGLVIFVRASGIGPRALLPGVADIVTLCDLGQQGVRAARAGRRAA